MCGCKRLVQRAARNAKAMDGSLFAESLAASAKILPCQPQISPLIKIENAREKGLCLPENIIAFE
jgi:hypothetical protein